MGFIQRPGKQLLGSIFIAYYQRGIPSLLLSIAFTFFFRIPLYLLVLSINFAAASKKLTPS
jgi:hypothetical protein